MRLWNIIGRRTTTWMLVLIATLTPTLFLPHEALPATGAPTMEDVRAEAVRGGYRLIDFEELRGRMEREPGRILLVDTRQIFIEKPVL